MQPGRLLPLYSSRTETKAQSCCFLAWSFCETKEKRNNTLQNQTLSILSWKPPLSMPGGRTMTISWRLDFWSCLPLKGQQQSTICSAYHVHLVQAPIGSSGGHRHHPLQHEGRGCRLWWWVLWLKAWGGGWEPVVVRKLLGNVLVVQDVGLQKH